MRTKTGTAGSLFPRKNVQFSSYSTFLFLLNREPVRMEKQNIEKNISRNISWMRLYGGVQQQFLPAFSVLLCIQEINSVREVAFSHTRISFSSFQYDPSRLGVLMQGSCNI